MEIASALLFSAHRAVTVELGALLFVWAVSALLGVRHLMRRHAP